MPYPTFTALLPPSLQRCGNGERSVSTISKECILSDLFLQALSLKDNPFFCIKTATMGSVSTSGIALPWCRHICYRRYDARTRTKPFTPRSSTTHRGLIEHLPSLKRLNANLKAVYSRSTASATKLKTAAEQLGFPTGSISVYSEDKPSRRRRSGRFAKAVRHHSPNHRLTHTSAACYLPPSLGCRQAC